MRQAIGSLAGNSMHVRALAAGFCAIFEAAKKIKKSDVLHDSVAEKSLKGGEGATIGFTMLLGHQLQQVHRYYWMPREKETAQVQV